ncbi:MULTISPECIES: hypothetical protein [Aneurinibacillus]|uniref:Uncharacterized protein n=1 Tax=Aneurinibacillus thermoaerophilus TaxID=143495 RepID=A0A1G8AG28_ANETH|nr:MULTISPECIES: hypothetical protein [Aneurinibacillus]AMA73526.1 hypothetical protein ACH33_12120 [Aneurinibacillus sp. XH2]MED0677668.1 hypothetical protein [Aneurinibacillus thermoaerophilus]MED0679685.1 hypothetical protein [Aneurinibacillus thermoaerophilus]MED0737318.1 hypothetical protein [Aneurinibacillus thermoaerophilus]MED0756082.1 hypothetical protein [Aneurinibacillus thermoaerophilus]
MSNLDDLFLYTNPTRRDVKNIYREEKYARGILLKNGDMIVWNGDIMHTKVMPFITETGVHFSLFNDKLEICWQFESWAEIQRRLVAAKPYFDNLEFPEDGRIVIDTRYYTHTDVSFPEIRYYQLFEEGFELAPLE